MSQDRIQSLQVGINIIDLIAKNNKPMRFNEIHAQTSMAKSNLYKYLNTLTDLGLLYRDKSRGVYMLGSKLVEYGMAAVDSENVVERITPFLLEINRKWNETVLLVMWTVKGPIVVRIFNGNKRFNIGAQLGSYLPLLSASGKIFAAFMAEGEKKEWMERELASLNQEERERLFQELEQIKKDHIAFAKEALVPQVHSISLPVLNFDHQLQAAITLVGFDQDIPLNKENPLCEFLLKIKREAGEAFGYREP